MSQMPATRPGDVAATFCATLAEEWERSGIRHAVIAPGSRSTPLAVALLRREGMLVHVFHDERSAGFAALGIGRATGVPAVLLCTSGTAAAHFLAPVIEAHQSRVPLVVCTADRPPELHGVGAPQTVDQTEMYGTAVRWYCDPGVPSAEAAHSWRGLARRAVNVARGVLPGPVHLNLPFREPLLGVADALPPPVAEAGGFPRQVRAAETVLDRAAGFVSGARGVIVAGRGSTPEVLDLAVALAWPVFADPFSGLRSGHSHVVNNFDPVLRSSAFAERHLPEVVIRVGEPPASKVLAGWMSRSAAIIQVSPDEAVFDPDRNVSDFLVGDVAATASGLAARVTPVDEAWQAAWNRASVAAQDAINVHLSGRLTEAGTARIVAGSCAPGTNLVVSSSMPVRDLEWYGGPMPGVRVHANRGTNGIDGVVSTAVGIALATGAPTVLHIGDIALAHDSNGLLGLARRGADVRIVVTNNDGGAIFSFLPQAAALDGGTFETLFGTPHGIDFSHLAAAHGLPHVLADDAAALAAALDRPGPVIIEVRSERSRNVAEHDALVAAVVAAVDAVTA